MLNGVNISTLQYSQAWIREPQSTFDTLTTVSNLSLIRLTTRGQDWNGGTVGGAMNTTFLGYVKDQLDKAANAGLSCVIDIHDFQSSDQFYAPNIGSTVTPAQFAKQWGDIATALVGYKGLHGYDLLNEPNGNVNVTSYYDATNQAFAQIRAKDTSSYVWVESPYNYTAVQNWDQNTGGPWIKKPGLTTLATYAADRVVYSPHSYPIDSGSLAGQVQMSQAGTQWNDWPTKYQVFIDWIKKYPAQAFALGETGCANEIDDTSTTDLNEQIRRMGIFYDALQATGQGHAFMMWQAQSVYHDTALWNVADFRTGGVSTGADNNFWPTPSPNQAPGVNRLHRQLEVYSTRPESTPAGTTAQMSALADTFGSSTGSAFINKTGLATITGGVARLDLDGGTVTNPGALYVDLSSGADTTTGGTATAPLRTIVYAASKFNSVGGTIYVKGTLTHTQQKITSSGAGLGREINIVNWPGFSPIIDGGCTWSGATPSDPWFSSDWLVGLEGSYLILDGFEIRNSPSYGLQAWHQPFCQVRNLKVHTCGQAGIVNSASDFTADSCEIYDNCRTNTNGPAGVIWAVGIQTNRISNTSFAKRITYKNLKVHDNWGEGIGFIETDGVTVQDCVAYDNWSVNLYLDGSTAARIDGFYSYATSKGKAYGFPTKPFSWSTENYNTGRTVPDQNYVLSNCIFDGGAVQWFYNTPNPRVNSTYQDVHFTGCTFWNANIVIGNVGSDASPTPNNCSVRDSIIKGTITNSNAGAWTFDHNNFPNGNTQGTNSSTTATAIAPTLGDATTYKPGTAIRGTGVSDTSLTVDFAKTSRPSPPTEGAWEI